MAGIPELSIIYDAGTDSVSAKCGLCSEDMRNNVEQGGTASEDITWFAAEFDLHMKLKLKHLPDITPLWPSAVGLASGRWYPR